MKIGDKSTLKRLLLIPFLFLLGLWHILIFADFTFPLLLPGFNPDFIRPVFNSLCHQIPEKMITAGDRASCVCARCSGIYAGIFIGALVCLIAAPYLKNSLEGLKKLFLIFSVIMLFDVIADDLSLYQYSHFFSFLTGIIWGQLVQMIIFVGI